MSRDARREAASGRPNEHDDDLTWLDYLRTAGGSVHDTRPAPPDRRESRDSTDRKRRHTGSEPERRNYPYPTYMRGPSDTSSIHNPPRGGVVLQSGSSRDTPIDLTSSPARPVRPSYSRMQSSDDSRGSGGSIITRYGRRGSDIVLPRWQPDNEVSKCPVCETEFSLLYRRHHCRKCGRVVCNRCSPHRITIPRQYIVQPPNPYLLEDDAPASPPGRVNSALGGGDTVRVCNPCVPDPWMPHTNNAASAPIAPVPPIPNMPTNNHIPPFGPFGQDPRIMALPPNQRPVGGPATPSGDSAARSRSNTYQPTGTPNAQLERLLASTRSIPPISTRYHGHRYSQSSGAGPVNYFSGHGHPPPTATPNDRSRDTMPSNSFGLTFNRVDPGRDPRLQNPAAMAPPIPQQSRPRRQVREEDECPVCGEELPPGDDIREAHVQECILTRFSSSPTRPAAIPALPDLSDSTPEGSRPRTNSFRPRGMYKSKATEKDCLGADGEPQECIICFEEFEPGDDLGTMECWCKFHRDCIRGWWEKKGAGSCPTHRLYD